MTGEPVTLSLSVDDADSLDYIKGDTLAEKVAHLLSVHTAAFALVDDYKYMTLTRPGVLAAHPDLVDNLDGLADALGVPIRH